MGFADATLHPQVALLAGNGLAIDLMRAGACDIRSWDTQRPFGWTVFAPETDSMPLLSGLPRLKAALQRPAIQSCGSDFDKLGILANDFANVRSEGARPRRQTEAQGDLQYLEFQTRYYLAVAFAQFQAALDATAIARWRWTDWLRSMRGRITTVISLNYDVVVEAACEAAGFLPWKIQAHSAIPTGALPVFKPHGSIDFDIADGILNVRFGFSVGNLSINGCDYPIKQLTRQKLLAWRQTADIVLPHEYSALSDVQWVKPWYPWIRERFRDIDCMVIAGVSFSPYDRSEVGYILESLRPDAIVIVANPDPPKALVRLLEESGRPWKEWANGPESV